MLMNDPCFVLHQHTELIFYVPAHKSNSLQEDMQLYTDVLIWFWADQSMLLLLIALCLAEKQLIPV